MTRADAERAARLAVGGLAQLRDAHREARGLPVLETLSRDLRYAFRTLRRDAGFTTFAILIVGLGIGASATVFSVLNMLIRSPRCALNSSPQPRLIVCSGQNQARRIPSR